MWQVIASRGLVWMLLCTLWMVIAEDKPDFRLNPKSPLNQHLPDCTKHAYPKPIRTSNWTGILCPMVKDEIGFLSEWVAYYELHGFTKFIFFDNNSTTSLAELDPWIKRGVVEIIRGPWWTDRWLFRNKKKKFTDMMYIKYRSEVICKQRGVELGIDVFASVDIDEYVLPFWPNSTVVDDMRSWFLSTRRGVMPMDKFNYNSIPHLLEPISLLTIEAYQTRHLIPNRMNYYNSISQKIALRLQQPENPEFNNDTQLYVVNCCDFHGCKGALAYRICHPLNQKGEKWKLEGRHLKWKDALRMNHYSRSLEKFMLKQQTYETAGNGNEVYDITNFFDRSFGYYYDDSAVQLACAVRDHLRNVTGEADYVRPGDFWYRNPEFGKLVLDATKRGRFGSGLGKVLSWEDMNPFPVGETYQRAHNRPVPTVP